MTTESDPTWPGYREIPPRLNIAAEVLEGARDAGIGDRTAFIGEFGRLSYAELSEQVERLAGGLAGIGIARGTPVLIRLPNCLEFVLSFLALCRIGALPVLQNSRLGPEEVAYVRAHSAALAAITLADIAAPVRALAGDLGFNPVDQMRLDGAQLDLFKPPARQAGAGGGSRNGFDEF